MRTILKGREPRSLVLRRAKSFADYENIPDKSELRLALVSEQRGLCCYCLSRIRPDKMKIEHWHAQTPYPDECLDYSNLLGACKGGDGLARDSQHCDTYKGDKDFSKNPANPAHNIERFVRFFADGTVGSDMVPFNRELNDVLKLNRSFLMNNRKAVLDGFIKALGGRRLSAGTFQRWLIHWSGSGSNDELPAYNQVVVYWLRKHI